MDKTVHILKKPLTMTLIAIFFGFVVGGVLLAAAQLQRFARWESC